MKLNLIEMTSSMFSVDGKDLVCEASTMENRHLQRIYDDAMDVGFAVKSERTGSVAVFVMSTPFYHGEGEDRELGGWKYTVSSESVRMHPECAGLTATVFND
jgi:hypothetical protein